MKTYCFNNFRFHHLGDLSGDVQIINMDTGDTVDVPGEAILEFIGQWVHDQKMAEFEQKEWWEVLGIKEPGA